MPIIGSISSDGHFKNCLLGAHGCVIAIVTVRGESGELGPRPASVS